MGLQEHRPAPKPLLFRLAVFSWLCPGGLCLWLPLACCLRIPQWQTLPVAWELPGVLSRGVELEGARWCLSPQTAWTSPA